MTQTNIPADTFVSKATAIAQESDKTQACRETAEAILEMLTVELNNAPAFNASELEQIFATDENGNIPEYGWGGGTLDTLTARAEQIAGFNGKQDFFALASYSIRTQAPEELKRRYLKLLVEVFTDVINWNCQS